MWNELLTQFNMLTELVLARINTYDLIVAMAVLILVIIPTMYKIAWVLLRMVLSSIAVMTIVYMIAQVLANTSSNPQTTLGIIQDSTAYKFGESISDTITSTVQRTTVMTQWPSYMNFWKVT